MMAVATMAVARVEAKVAVDKGGGMTAVATAAERAGEEVVVARAAARAVVAAPAVMGDVAATVVAVAVAGVVANALRVSRPRGRNLISKNLVGRDRGAHAHAARRPFPPTR